MDTLKAMGWDWEGWSAKLRGFGDPGDVTFQGLNFPKFNFRGGEGVKLPEIQERVLWVVATQILFMFIPNFGEMIQFDSYFFRWVGSTTN